MLPRTPPEVQEAPPVIRVLVVDDHPLVRAHLFDLLESVADMHPVGAAADGQEALDLAAQVAADVVLMDVKMPGLSGIETTRQLVDGQSSCRILMHSSDARATVIAAARGAGAAGYLLKGARSATILSAIRRVHGGGTVWPKGANPTDGPQSLNA